MGSVFDFFLRGPLLTSTFLAILFGIFIPHFLSSLTPYMSAWMQRIDFCLSCFIFLGGLSKLQMRISCPFLCAKDLRMSLLIMRTRSLNSPVHRGYICTRTRWRPVPSTCTVASSCNGDRGLRLRTTTVVTMPSREGGGWTQ